MSEKCSVCGQRPAFWYPKLECHLCGGHRAQAEKQWRADLERWAQEDNEEQEARNLLVAIGIALIFVFVAFTAAWFVSENWR